MPDRLDSGGKDESSKEADIGGDERSEDIEAGGSIPADESLNSCPLREWPDNDAHDLNTTHGAA